MICQHADALNEWIYYIKFKLFYRIISKIFKLFPICHSEKFTNSFVMISV